MAAGFFTANLATEKLQGSLYWNFIITTVGEVATSSHAQSFMVLFWLMSQQLPPNLQPALCSSCVAHAACSLLRLAVAARFG
jgi:hypothetical protein